jgi:DNA-directed RNA polymerase specialized sigma24 family protein
MAKKAPPTEEAYATEDEVVVAIRALTAPQLYKLRRFGSMKAAALAGLGLGISEEDLMQEALRRTLSGARKWSKRVAFSDHLLGAIRSVASHAAKKAKGVALVPTDPLDADADDPPSLELGSALPDSERLTGARRELQRIQDHFEDDERVLLIIEGLGTEMSGPEIQRDLGITQTEYETAMKRLRRWVRAKE